MAKNAPSPEPDDANDGTSSTAQDQTQQSRRKLMIAGAGAALLLTAGGGAWAVLVSGEQEAAAQEGGRSAEGGAESMIDVPAIVTNMRRGGSESGYLKLRFMLVAATPEKADIIKTRLPAIIDRFQPFLRELRPEDLNGAAAAYRIKEELLHRCQQVTGPNMVDDLLIQDLLQQ